MFELPSMSAAFQSRTLKPSMGAILMPSILLEFASRHECAARNNTPFFVKERESLRIEGP